MLRGNILAKVDDKGRLKLPAAFRSIIEPEYGNQLVVTSVRGDCALVYPVSVFAGIEQRLGEASKLEPLVTRLRNAYGYFGHSCTMDSQGRVLLHPLLRERAELDGEVAVLGQQSYLEVWNRSKLEDRVLANPLTDQELMRLAELGF